MLDTSNPLLQAFDLPPFERLRPEHAEPAVDAVLQRGRETVAAVTAESRHTWREVVEPLERMELELERVWSPIRHLSAVMDSDAMRTAHNACLQKISDYQTELSQNEALFRKFQALREDPSWETLSAGQRKIVDNALRDFRLAGVGLPAEKKARFKTIQQELARLTTRFDENLLDATQGWSRHFDDAAALAGLPESALALARQLAEREGKPGWLINLEFPSYYPVLAYADDRDLRAEVYEAYATRASDQGPNAGRWDNTEVMAQILALRHEAAQLVGFANYAEYSLATKMAGTPERVLGFLRELAARAKPAAQREFAELEAFARERDGIEALQAWDVAYYSEKLRQQRFDFSQEQLRPYFPLPRVLSGLFAVVERIYGIRVEPAEAAGVWHPDVRFFRIFDADGELRGQFYLDLYARPHKRGGAWMDECRPRFRDEDRLYVPVAYLTCNFTPPVGERPALLTHDEVVTLFHEFGHGLHHLLSRVDYPSVAGINGVPWDAVELPSQFMENWCWERPALDLISGHFETGEPLPADILERMRAARHFQAAMQMVRQLEFSLFDFRLHLEYDPAQGPRIYEILEQVRDEVAVVRPPAFNRFAHGFSHIFAGGYGAGYYSYKWAEVLAADAYSAFEEAGLFDRATGRRFMEIVLEQGGTREPLELFVEFRGREPSVEPLMRQHGL